MLRPALTAIDEFMFHGGDFMFHDGILLVVLDVFSEVADVNKSMYAPTQESLCERRVRCQQSVTM